jgi:hypothetical protein
VLLARNPGPISIDGIFCCLGATFVQYLQKFTLTFVHLWMLVMHKVLLLLGVVFMSALHAWAVEKISVAAAADLNLALTEIVAHSGKQGGNSVEISVAREKH